MLIRIGVLLSVCVWSFTVAAADAPATQPADWKPIFNGKDLAGWYTYLKAEDNFNDPTHIFQVEDGAIHIYKDAEEASTQPFGYIATKDDFGDCRIRLQYKWGAKRFGTRATAKRDSGLLYFFTGKDGAYSKGPWPYSVECQIQEGDVGDIYCIGTQCSSTIDPEKQTARQPTFKDAAEGGIAYTSPPKGNNRIIRSEMLETDGWNTIEVELRGDSAVHTINGKVNMKISNAKAPNPDKMEELVTVKKGKLVLQAEGAEVWYRKIEIQPIPAQ